ncbi:terminase small subunit [Rhodomicrobium sp.]|uniref:terminase small subunit n=1 Tax=Rhodomicrobium sp. TaxID=2720632 RepID=UPI0039E2C75E
MAKNPKKSRPREPASSPLTERALRFASEYVIDADGKAAAMRAGYAEKSAATTASRLLGDPRIQAIIEEARTRVAASAEVTAERIIGRLAEIAFAPIADKPTLKHQLAALGQLTRFFAPSRVELSGSVTMIDPDAVRLELAAKLERIANTLPSSSAGS